MPPSEVRTEGTPNLATQENRKALTQDSDMIEINRATSFDDCLLNVLRSLEPDNNPYGG